MRNKRRRILNLPNHHCSFLLFIYTEITSTGFPKNVMTIQSSTLTALRFQRHLSKGSTSENSPIGIQSRV